MTCSKHYDVIELFLEEQKYCVHQVKLYIDMTGQQIRIDHVMGKIVMIQIISIRTG